jgi:phospholipase D1/2
MGLLLPGRNVWRLERCNRAAVLIDGASFFAAVRSAFLAARHTIFVVGWDIDSRTPLVGSEPPRDGLPTTFGAFLAELVSRRPALQIHLLLWDYSLVYAHEREMLPRLALDWGMPSQVKFCLDATVSLGSSQHQKLVVVDDAVAFCGGLDLTVRRWDTPRHEISNPKRVDPHGAPYRPFHDVQMLVDGKAAEALALLARQRWCRAIGEREPVLRPTGDSWPAEVAPDFTDIEIGIARTQPRFTNEPEAHEVKQLFHESIDWAQRSIYIENQFTTSRAIARHLARRLRTNPDLEVVIVAPHAHESLLERRTMRNGRIRFWRTVKAAGGPRVRLVSPEVVQEHRSVNVMVHSKVMVIDDTVLRVGSANLNNRSMGADTECDLAIEAADDRQRKQIRQTRNRLLAHHCGVDPEQVERALVEKPSLVDLAESLSHDGHRLKPIDDGAPDRGLLIRLAERVADPSRPLRLSRFAGHLLPRLLASRSGPT